MHFVIKKHNFAINSIIMLDEQSIFANKFSNDTPAISGGRRQRPLIKGGKFCCTYDTLNKYKHIT